MGLFEEQRSGRYLTVLDRHRIATLRARGESMRAIATLVDRCSRSVRLVHLPADVRDGLHQVFTPLTETERLTLTWDQGLEMAGHDGIDAVSCEGVYFAHPGSPWEGGSNENTNRLVRQYFPKVTDLSIRDADRLKALADELNQRPRKILDWRTPAEVYARAMTSSTD